jgi:hypothetical protein
MRHRAGALGRYKKVKERATKQVIAEEGVSYGAVSQEVSAGVRGQDIGNFVKPVTLVS